MRYQKIILLSVAVLAIIYVFGLIVPRDNCSTIGECMQCWETEPLTVQSELCPSAAPCVASPAQQQHNAIVDVLLCACDNAKKNNYANQNLNKEIETVLVVSNITGDSIITARQFCDSPGLLLTKRQYG